MLPQATADGKVSTIFIPITFIAGIYGMNFKHMPEVEWSWGCALIWAVMIAIVVAMVIMFKKKNRYKQEVICR